MQRIPVEFFSENVEPPDDWDQSRCNTCCSAEACRRETIHDLANFRYRPLHVFVG
jgi:hypothetical protein